MGMRIEVYERGVKIEESIVHIVHIVQHWGIL